MISAAGRRCGICRGRGELVVAESNGFSGTSFYDGHNPQYIEPYIERRYPCPVCNDLYSAKQIEVVSGSAAGFKDDDRSMVISLLKENATARLTRFLIENDIVSFTFTEKNDWINGDQIEAKATIGVVAKDKNGEIQDIHRQIAAAAAEKERKTILNSLYDAAMAKGDRDIGEFVLEFFSAKINESFRNE